jgi:hypothetical protein
MLRAYKDHVFAKEQRAANVKWGFDAILLKFALNPMFLSFLFKLGVGCILFFQRIVGPRGGGWMCRFRAPRDWDRRGGSRVVSGLGARM